MFIVISLSEWPLMANIILIIYLFSPLYVTVLLLVVYYVFICSWINFGLHFFPLIRDSLELRDPYIGFKASMNSLKLYT